MNLRAVQSISAIGLIALGLASCSVKVTASLNGTVFDDLNKNGIHEAGEAGLKDWKIYLDTNGNSAYDTGERSVLTSDSGTYSFADVPIGSVKVGVHPHLGFNNIHKATISTSSYPVQTKIINGTVVGSASKYPFQVALVQKADGSQFCGGTLVAPHWVLTAAHCFFTGKTQDTFAAGIQVRIGATDLSADPLQGETINVSQIINHSDYLKPVDNNNDIALIKLSSNATGGAIMSLAEASDTNLNTAGTAVRVIGWGRTEGGSSSAQLREVAQEIATDALCASSYNLTNVMLCAKTPKGETIVRDSCQGDSGGPLFTQAAPIRQVGVVSFGTQNCNEINVPGVYARVTAFDAWLGTTTGRAATDTDVNLDLTSNTPNLEIAAEESN